MKRFMLAVLTLCAVTLMSSGCTMDNLLAPVAQQYDARVTVVSTSGVPISGAFVRIVETNDHSYTDVNGQTDAMRTPPSATSMHIYVEYGQINKTVTVGLSRDPTRNQYRIAI